MAGSHIAIPTILKIGSGTLGNVGKYLQASGFKKAVILWKWTCGDVRKDGNGFPFRGGFLGAFVL